MRRLSLILLPLVFVFVFAMQRSESPHGKSLDISCNVCHNPDGWKIDTARFYFDHDSTQFELEGQHQSIDCRQCHQSLVFSEAGSDCMSCHTDIHQQTVGMDCERCHSPQNWIVSNITEIHQMSRFPLVGAHLDATCSQCHQSASNLLFEPLSLDCYSCHEQNYLETTNPDHVESNFSTDCNQCHRLSATSWEGAGFDHSYFPLEQAHNIADCFQCHTQGEPYANAKPECVECHQQDYDEATQPDHINSGFSTDCALCHSLAPGWSPAVFEDHDAEYFPVYSGKHKDEWSSCIECHPNVSDYKEFTCTDCHDHNQSDMNSKHDEVGGYIYESIACLECHPTGDGDKVFDHNKSDFPLTGAHITTNCTECHTNGFQNTPIDCFDCHEPDYLQSSNPNHQELNLATNCIDCHTTQADWKPASFDVHNTFFELKGAHASIQDCADCHTNNNYSNTPNTCEGCHINDYNQTNDPPHQTAQFSTDCESCHTQNAWEPSTFDHDSDYFPIYTGKHDNEWNTCADCHNNPSNYSIFTCIDCHEHNQQDMADKHSDVNDYQYNSAACFECHPDGSQPDFNFIRINEFKPVRSKK